VVVISKKGRTISDPTALWLLFELVSQAVGYEIRSSIFRSPTIRKLSLSGPLDVDINLLYGERAISVDVSRLKVQEDRVQELRETEIAVTILVISFKGPGDHHILDILEDQISLVVNVLVKKRVHHPLVKLGAVNHRVAVLVVGAETYFPVGLLRNLSKGWTTQAGKDGPVHQNPKEKTIHVILLCPVADLPPCY